jgi:hypothetical protein
MFIYYLSRWDRDGKLPFMPPKAKYPEYVALRLESAMRKKLQEMADAEERTIGAMIRIVLREGLAAREKKGRKKTSS